MTESIAATAPAQHDLAELLATGVVLADGADLRIQYLNAAAEDLLGISRRRACDLVLTEVAEFEDEWRTRLHEAGRDHLAITGREVAFTCADGHRRLVDVVVSPVRGDDGRDLLVIELAGADRHRRIAREEALRTQEQANRALLRGLAHEIRNPLAGLRGAAQLLERELAAGKLTEHTGVIVREADRLRDLVERMIGPARPLQPETINLHEVTERVAALLRAEAGAGVTIDTRYDPSIPPLDADRDRLIQAVLNLGRNALQAVGETGRVTLRTLTQRQFTIGGVRHRLVAVVEVIDDGPGIAEPEVETLFQPMVSGRPEGSGLGLTIAQSLVGQHGGLIECDSEPGHTVFRAVLPIATGGN